jgi:hypothetical protein
VTERQWTVIALAFVSVGLVGIFTLIVLLVWHWLETGL